MDFKNFFNKLIKYDDKNNYNFSIMNNKTDGLPDAELTTPEADYKVFTNIKENLDFLKSKYNTLICSDIIIREFNMFAYNENHKCFIIYIDGLSDSTSINDFILKSLMTGKHRYNNPFDGDLSEYVYNCLLPQNSVKKIENYKDAFSGINMGDCLLFIDTLNVAFDIDVKKY